MPNTTLDLPRRGLLLRALQGTIGLTVLAIFYPVVRFLRPRKATSVGEQQVVAPFRVKELASTSSKIFDYGGQPCLVILTKEGAKLVAAGQSPGPDDVKAFNAVCTHVQCTVKYRPSSADIFCNCHEGVYDLTGRNVAGPPPRPLEVYRVTLRGERGEEEILVSRKS